MDRFMVEFSPDFFSWKYIAESAYKAYSASTNNKNFRGEDMPKWADLPQTIRTAWEAAVRQVGSCLDGYRVDGNGKAIPPDEARWNGWTPPVG